ncbi:hypothetical protein Kpol_534p15 [Vanderwaltozyma polyspora DSM 70294]|uniref:Uncharacterized protein n=1 Tax=Vanderwaltozyma polyspora (strain ATCC 22028 / DSM 70294 / BCRC 21397 / CBS 2163 / NBRC 10782 / NRRL Y-8283 / UCD 57-17) TaxID=436907 RepID=A7TJJ3_VANPO|nr:uncharacterized protein Kpol_534p15 [Vanderwaltozyma polyspora DSM 70294]EDO17536.1 hypothetical protein Kpol_534p15 [Vanderwaltozyma polyspora DSM 70294]
MLRFQIKWVRQYSNVSSINRPLFETVFPKQKFIKKILFDLDSRLTYSKLQPLFKYFYENMDNDEVEITANKLWKGITGDDLMLMKKVLERTRRKTKATNKHLLVLENSILDKAADVGNQDAIAILSFDVLKDPKNSTDEDIDYARMLTKQLYKSQHPMTIKFIGDLSLRQHNDVEAEKYYKKFLELEDDTVLAGEVYGQLGELYFRRANVFKAEEHFKKSVKLTPMDLSVRSYYYLAQINMNSYPQLARTLLELCATQGFKEAFRSLGYLEMNYYNSNDKAYEWFKLGMELYDVECYFGFFDCCLKLKDTKSAILCIKSLEKLKEVNFDHKPLIDIFLASRESSIKKLKIPVTDSDTTKKDVEIIKADAETIKTDVETTKPLTNDDNNRWNL